MRHRGFAPAALAALTCIVAVAVPRSAQAAVVFNNANTAAVTNCTAGVACGPVFHLTAPTFVGQIVTYHWTGGQGEVAGRVSIGLSGATAVAAAVATGSPATKNVLANWTVSVNRTLAAGAYTVVDTRPSTWSQNAGSQHKGFAIVSGTATSAGAVAPIAKPGGPPAPLTAPKPIACTLRNGFQFLCFGQVITLNENPIVYGTMLTLTVNPASGYSFDPATVLVVEPVAGVGFGGGLRTLCGALSGTACPFTGPKAMTVPVASTASALIPPGRYLLSAENWNPSIVVGGVGICTPTCTDADAGVVTFGTTPPSTLQIISVTYPVNNQIGVAFVDPRASVNQVQVRPWTGYQWGSPISWNPGTSGMSAGQLFIAVGGCHPGSSYTLYITLSDAAGQQASQKFTYTCV